MSTLNKKLGQVSNISFCTAAGVNRSTTLYTGENGRFSIKVGFKQGSTVNPFQVQYRRRSRWTAANEKKKGAKWTAWSDWKAAAAVKKADGTVIVAKDGVCTGTKAANSWNRSNLGVNKKGAYKVCYEFASHLIGKDFDARQFQFRVRRYNAKTKKHGPWVTQTLTAYKKAGIMDETMHRLPGGGVIFDFNLRWDRGGTYYIDSIMDADGRELLKEPLTRAGTYDSRRTDTSNPGLRDGYRPIQFEVGGNNLKRHVEFGETLTLNVYYKTKDGAKTALTCTKVSEEDLALNKPIVRVESNEDTALVYVNVYKADAADAVEDAGCVALYTYHGKNYTMLPHYDDLDLDVNSTTERMAQFRFRPPLGVEVMYIVTITNSYDSACQASETYTLTQGRFILTNKKDVSITASIYANGKLSMSTEGIKAVGLPHGRSLPVAFFGMGKNNKITLSGVIVESDDYTSSVYCKYQQWDKVRANQNALYMLRSPDGDVFTVVVTKVDISSEFKGLREITVDMEEVSE